MLQRIHDTIGKWGVIVLGLLFVTFVFWGVDFSMSVATFAAKVNGETISLDEFERELNLRQNEYQRSTRRELTEDLRLELRRQTVNSLVRLEAMQQRVQETGYRVSDERVDEFVRAIPAFQVDGVFSLPVFLDRLAYERMSPTAFVEFQRQELEVLDMQRGFADSTFLTPAEFRRFIELYFQRREVGYALFDVASFTPGIVVEDEAIAAHYDSNRDNYRTAETVDIEYLEIALADIAAGIEIGDDELRAIYDAERDRFATVEERQARHILVRIDAGDEEAARAAAQRALERVQGGEDFAAVAREVSDDAGTRAAGGDLGWIARGGFDPAFEDALFAIEAGGGLAGPVRTEFGFEVVRLDGIRQGETVPFETVRDELLAEEKQRLADDQYDERVEALSQAAFDARNELATVATATGLPLKTVAGMPRSGESTAFADPAPIVQAAFADEVLGTGRNSEIVELTPEHVVVLRVTAHHPPTVRPLDDVREQIRGELARARALVQLETAAAAFHESIVAGGDPAVLAPAHKAEWHAPVWVERSNAELPTELLSAVFASPKPRAGAPPVREDIALASGNHAVYVLAAVEPGSPENVPQAERDGRQQAIADAFALAEITSYGAEITRQATVRVPDDVLDPQY